MVRGNIKNINLIFLFIIKKSGDSGGPLLIRQSDGRWIVLGITSYGSATAANIAPGVYVKISAFAKWLEPFVNSS